MPHSLVFGPGDQEPPDSLSREALEDAIGAIAADQEAAGLDIITDGRLHGDNYAEQAVYYYYKRLGYDLKGGYLGFPIYSRLHAGTLTHEVKRRGAIMVEQAKALKRVTKKPTKVQYTGVQVLAQATNDLHYKSSRDRAMAIAAAINEDILEVEALGVDFIQLDEFTWPYFYEDWAIEAFNRAVAGVKSAKIIVHVCWGNWGGTPAYIPDETAKAGEIFDLTKRKGKAPSATASVVPKSYEAKIDVLNLENCGRRSDDLSGLGCSQTTSAAAEYQFLGRRHRREEHDHRDRRGGRRAYPPVAGIRSRGSSRGHHRLRPYPAATLYRPGQAPCARPRHQTRARRARFPRRSLIGFRTVRPWRIRVTVHSRLAAKQRGVKLWRRRAGCRY